MRAIAKPLCTLWSDCRGVSIWVSLLFTLPVIGLIMATSAYVEKSFDQRHQVDRQARACGTVFAVTSNAGGDCAMSALEQADDSRLRGMAGGQFDVVGNSLPFLSEVLTRSLHGELFAVSQAEEVAELNLPLFADFAQRTVGRGYTTFTRTRTEEAELEDVFSRTCQLLGSFCK